MSLTFGELFAGIGGIGLGLERAGMEVRWHVERDPYCRRVLAKHWPHVPCYEDVHDVGAHNLEPVDLIAGGFPCQPVSVAGKRKAQDDERWLWPEFARIIREMGPRYALMENVPGLLVRGFGDVLGDLASLGYDAEWCVLGADDVGAPHRRKRVLIVATRAEHRGAVADAGSGRGQDDRLRAGRHEPRSGGTDDVADTEGVTLRPGLRESQPGEEWRGRSRDGGRARDVADATGTRLEGHRKRGGFAARRGGGYDAPSGGWWLTEPNVGRVAHGISARVDRLRALGNAVVPQVAEWIAHRILEAESTP